MHGHRLNAALKNMENYTHTHTRAGNRVYAEYKRKKNAKKSTDRNQSS